MFLEPFKYMHGVNSRKKSKVTNFKNDIKPGLCVKTTRSNHNGDICVLFV